MKDFIINNWQFIAEIGLTLVVFLVALFRKKAKVVISSDTVSDVLCRIPEWINEAEKEFGPGHGTEKFNYVFRAALSLLAESVDVSIDNLPGSTLLFIREYIESVLSTPTKKEVSEDEKR